MILPEEGWIAVPLELKGLKSNMLRLQSTVDRLNSIASKANDKGWILESHLTDIGTQLESHVDDIEFAANVLGNSSNGSGEGVQPLNPPVASQQPETQIANVDPVSSSPEVEQTPHFRP